MLKCAFHGAELEPSAFPFGGFGLRRGTHREREQDLID